MKQRWLYAVLILSLAVNAGAIGFYGVKKYRDDRHFRSYVGKWFKPGTTPAQIDRLFSDLTKTRKPWFDSLRTATRELGMLATEPSPDSAQVNAALDRIARAAREQQRLLHENTREFGRLYQPERLEFYRRMSEAELDSILRAESSAAEVTGGKR
ncbi:periplasmic heavy metal sensor [candidate division WOR-3 bacterium]|uniref:Periplasmic heavy metal sensor n=1 Tax=candidate division WOR-3 bacterium TaxID=2052148 RepID=A0A937XBV6_UNCW3|nr:periplasmic heavy metal sensor [candidate division WOR-3 bacterium]